MPGSVPLNWHDKLFRVIYEVDNSGDMLAIKDVVDGEVIILKVVPSKLCNGWTLFEKVRNSLIFIATHKTRYRIVVLD